MCQQTGVRSDLNHTLSWCRSEFLSPAGVGETCLQQQVRGGGWQGHFLYDLSRQLLAGETGLLLMGLSLANTNSVLACLLHYKNNSTVAE